MKNLIYTSLITILLSVISSSYLLGQIKVGDNPSTINSSALLEMESSDKGLLTPRMTTVQRDAISSPATGLLIYNTDNDKFNYYDGTNWKELKSKFRNKHILIQSASDFPTAVGGIITLDSDYIYEIDGAITINDQIDINGAKIYGQDVAGDKLIYSGSNALFTGIEAGTVRNITITAPVAGSKAFNLTDASRTKMLIILDCLFIGCKNVGYFEGYNSVILQSNGYFANENGAVFNGVEHLLLKNQNYADDNSGTYVKLSDASTFSFIEINGGFFSMQSANSATGFDFGTGVTITNGAEIRSNFHGDGTMTTGTPSEDWTIYAHGLPTRSDDVATGHFYQTASAQTNITAVNTPVKVAGTTTGVDLFRTTSSVDNRITYTGKKTRYFRVSGALSFTAQETNKLFNFYIFKNGTMVSSSKQKVKIGNTIDARSVALSAIVEMSENDYIEVWVENISNASDVTLESINLSIL